MCRKVEDVLFGSRIGTSHFLARNAPKTKTKEDDREMFGNERADRRMCGRKIRTSRTKSTAKRPRISTRKHAHSAQSPLHNSVSYFDCLADRASTPTDPAEKLLFQFLMVGGMVTFMATFNGMRHSGLAFFATYHWIYPLVACVALFLRLALTTRIVDFLAPKLVFSHFHGFAATIAYTALNTLSTAPLLNILVTLLLYGRHGLLGNIAANLPISMVVAFLVSLFIVGPIVKMVYNNFLTTERGLRWLSFVERTAMPWVYVINS